MESNLKPYPNKCYLPFILYPPAMIQNPEGSSFANKHLDLDKSADDYVVYLSVPFCRVRCKSCPYFVGILDPQDKHNQESRYVDALIKDMKKWASYPRWKEGNLRSVYIGGGTGTILKTSNLKRIIDTLFEYFPMSDDYSITLEGNARDYDDEKLDYVANSKITRVSLGVQSFDPELLKVIGSPHAADESTQVIKGLQARGFYNIQLDLMYNLPGHDMNVWLSDLKKIRELNVKHFTIYMYRVHSGTMQEQNILSGKLTAPLDREAPFVKEMYREAIAIAKDLGYNMYMFDHFAEEGYESDYNYWTFKEAVDALGIGAGAYSFINSYRTGTAKDIEGYIDSVTRDEHLINAVSHKMSDQVRKERYIIFALQYFGVEFATYRHKFNADCMQDFGDVIRRLQAKGLIELSSDNFRLTQLGKNWHMNVFLEFFNPDFWGDMASLDAPNWAMNIPMVELSSKRREYWLGEIEMETPATTQEKLFNAFQLLEIDTYELHDSTALHAELGMDSQEVIELIGNIEKLFAVKLPANFIQQQETIGSLTSKLENLRLCA